MSEESLEELFPAPEQGEPLTSIVFKGVREEAEKIIKYLNTNYLLEEKDYFRKILVEKKMLKKIEILSSDVKPCCLALDTSFTSPPLELTGGKLLVITRSHLFYGCRSLGGEEKTGTVGYVRFIQGDEKIGTPYSKIVEREFIREVLVKKKNGLLDLDIVLLDGELFPRIPPGYVGKRNSESVIIKAYNRILDLTQQILELAEETNTVIVGVIKRVYGMDLQVVLDNPMIKVNDKAFSTFILNSGEWIDIGSYTSILNYLNKYIEKHRANLEPRRIRSLIERREWITRVINAAPTTKNVRVATYKAIHPTYFMIATKIEAYPTRKTSLDNIVSYLSYITGNNGVPDPIDKVDTMSMIKKELLYIVQQQLYTELTNKTKNPLLALSLAGLTNPEKMFKIGFK
ncbi:hypothetical protein Smar_0583 [Staphylothermus marinus F1]|uniref:NurA domain-containing protein n=1 Tax=Staphylothermus marinus (strain ATCC 43588 / DSM 3639 / JCM 9404 / F1) TaxID=399550 RepID=A3DM30_STAMF|nr:DNA double-strand break repair nuclease NurA [Staphylothermus marinus]ABN69690.1 hypothetical protein Smar_0583 [Staphylothermus marinus F1]